MKLCVACRIPCRSQKILLNGYMYNIYNINSACIFRAEDIRLFVIFSQLVRTHVKVNIKALHFWPFVKETHRSPTDSLQKGPVMRKASWRPHDTVYPKKYAHGFCFAVLCCGYTLTDFPISIRLTSLALWQSKDCPSASKATLMNMDEYFMWIHYERLHNHYKAKHNKTVCIFLGIYCTPLALNHN